MLSKELQVGKAGEYLVCADLILKGFVAFPSEQGLPYDVVLDIGHKILKVQVKTTICPRVVPQRNKQTECYIFNIRRHGNNRNIKKYLDNDVDLFALVCLDTRSIGYLKNEEMPTTSNFRVDRLKGTYHDEKHVALFEKVKNLIGTGLSQTKIASILNTNISTVNKMFAEGYKPFLSDAKYFSQLQKEAEWFNTL